MVIVTALSQAHLCAPLYKLLLHVPLVLNDLALIDEQTYLSLKYMLEHPIKDVFFETFVVEVDSYPTPNPNNNRNLLDS